MSESFMILSSSVIFRDSQGDFKENFQYLSSTLDEAIKYVKEMKKKWIRRIIVKLCDGNFTPFKIISNVPRTTFIKVIEESRKRKTGN